MKKLKIKRLLFLLPLAAMFIMSACTTAQVELRMEYDKLTRAMINESGEEAYTTTAENNETKAVLTYIYAAAQTTKTMVTNFAGMEKAQIDAINPAFFLMQSVPEGESSQSLVTTFPYYIKDVKISVMTLGFKVTKTGDADMTADAHFMLTVTGTATDKDGNVLKDKDKKDITYSAIVILLNLNPAAPAPIEINLHKYKISADSQDIPVYNLIYDYKKIDGEWKITAVADSGKDVVPLDELMSLYS